jgi:peptidyl-tRNA hydrolase
MSNKQQTAVEWLIHEIESKGDAWENASIKKIQISIDASEYAELKAQAKELEKQQIMDAHLTGLIHPLEIEATKQAEQYYNETFNQQP